MHSCYAIAVMYAPTFIVVALGFGFGSFAVTLDLKPAFAADALHDEHSAQRSACLSGREGHKPLQAFLGSSSEPEFALYITSNQDYSG